MKNINNKLKDANLAFYVTLNELIKGGHDCEISYNRPSAPYIIVWKNRKLYAGRGANLVSFKGQILAEEWRVRFDEINTNEPEHEPSEGLLNDALEKLIELKILK